MSDQVFEQHVDEHGNVSVRVSQDIIVLTRDDADRLAARLDQLKAENKRLRELVRDMHKALFSLNLDHCQACPREDACVFMHKSFDCSECAFERDMRELGVEP